jgi:manganese-transporting P-type ATPase
LNYSRQFHQIKKLNRDEVESHLKFAGFLIFHSPLKPDAIDALKMLADSSHRVRYNYYYSREESRSHGHQCIMITGDNPLTALHVARDVEIVDREALILDLKETPAHEKGTWDVRTQPYEKLTFGRP